ncbi:MAG: DUF1735 domain-containing protein [Bacteroidetes bacterium]|nr:DUF1735 domain-containing protein [Bacteroidota bacterium]
MKRYKGLIYLWCILVLLNACQKDTGKEEETPSSPVGFTTGAQYRTDAKLSISTTSQTISGILNIKVQSGTAASALTVKLADSTAMLVNRYNTANGTSIMPLPADRWSMPAELAIPQGGTSAAASITVNRTDGLNPNQLYAIGITISTNNGYTIPDSSRQLLIVLRVTNILDGRYSMKGRFYHPGLEPGFAPHVLSVELHTVSANSVMLYWPFAGSFVIPATSGGGNPYCCLSNSELMITTNSTNNTVTPLNANVIGPVYANLQTYNSVSYTNYMDTNNGTVHLAFGTNLGVGGTLLTGISRVWIDTLTYLGPR